MVTRPSFLKEIDARTFGRLVPDMRNIRDWSYDEGSRLDKTAGSVIRLGLHADMAHGAHW